jgi:isopentenyl-diphosphate delta-isomerase
MEENRRRVILVDEQDREIGVCGKIDAHRDGKLHRAISVLVFNSRGEWLIQKRAEGKYHSGGLWSNSCCSHPEPGEETLQAAQRALWQELNIRCELNEIATCVYDLDTGNGLVEKEYNHVFKGNFDGDPIPDPAEVADWQWIECKALAEDMAKRRDSYTSWFRLIFGNVKDPGC